MRRRVYRANTTGHRADTGPEDPATNSPAYEDALAYHRLGFSVIPKDIDSPKPHVRWRKFQTERPTPEKLRLWFGKLWPKAGVSVVLGPISNLMVVEVSGMTAHKTLVDRIGGVPQAPTTLIDDRLDGYRLFFRHPEFVPAWGITLWHKGVLIKSKGSTVALPPIVSPFGRSFRWFPDRSLDDLGLPELPEVMCDALFDPYLTAILMANA